MRDELSSDTDVTWLDDEELQVADIWLLSLDGGFSSSICNYEVVKDVCKSMRLEHIEVYRVCKSMTQELNSKE